MIRQVVKFVSILGLILLYLLLAAFVWITPGVNSWSKRKHCAWLLHKISRWGCWVFGFKITSRGECDNTNARSALIVSNHLSYTDILLISAQTPTCFVTSLEIRRTPVLGQICLLAGCLFVDRKNRVNLQKEISDLTEGLRHELNVTIFPEATSTNGESVLRFRRPLFNSAIFANVPVWPLCINYRSIDEREIDLTTRDLVCWYGDMDFLPHLWKLCSAKNINIQLELRPKLLTHGMSDQEVSELAHKEVSSVFQRLNRSPIEDENLSKELFDLK